MRIKVGKHIDEQRRLSADESFLFSSHDMTLNQNETTPKTSPFFVFVFEQSLFSYHTNTHDDQKYNLAHVTVTLHVHPPSAKYYIHLNE